MLAYLQCDPKVLRSLHCGRVQHVDYVSNGGNGSEVTFEAETVVECVLAMYRDRKEEAAVLSKLEVLASTTMSSNKEREDFSRLIVSGGVREVFMVHVGGTRCVPFRTDHIMNILARITLTVEVIRTCIFIFLFDV